LTRVVDPALMVEGKREKINKTIVCDKVQNAVCLTNKYTVAHRQ